jgi:hypothetical protein
VVEHEIPSYAEVWVEEIAGSSLNIFAVIQFAGVRSCDCCESGPDIDPMKILISYAARTIWPGGFDLLQLACQSK